MDSTFALLPSMIDIGFESRAPMLPRLRSAVLAEMLATMFNLLV